MRLGGSRGAELKASVFKYVINSFNALLMLLLSGKHAVPHLVANLPGGGQSQPVRALSEETVVSVLSTLQEVLGSSLESAKTLRSSQGIERLVLINKDG